MDIELVIKKNQFSPKFYPLLLDYTHRWELYNGSAGSGKSYFISQKIITRCLREKIKVLVCRRYATTLRNTCFALFKDILSSWKIKQFVKIRETDFNIQFPNGSEIIFLGLDEETKLLSLTNISCIFVEEAFEITQDMAEQLNLRMRGTNVGQQIIMAWNPISKSSWLYQFTEVNLPDNALYVKSTYLDNPFLPEEYVKALEELKVRNPRKAEVFVYGLWGTDSEGLVLTNWRAEEFDVQSIVQKKGIEHRVGMDFGYQDPSAIVETLFDRENNTIYVINEFYRQGQTLDQLKEAIERMGLKKSKIYADAAEPRTIDFFRRNYLNIYPCIKGAGSVESGIAFLQNNTIIVLPKCQSVINELDNFSYIKDKKTGLYTEKMTHEYSHSIDAMRYAYSDIYTNNKLRTLDKKVLGIR